MLKRQSSYWKKSLPLLVGLLMLYVIFRRTKSPSRSVEEVFRGTEYENLVPFIIAQAKHETGNFTSNLFRNHNNMFGMKVPVKRKSFRNGETESGFSTFESTTDSARDFLEYLRSVNFPKNVDSFQYVAALKNRRYFEDTFGNYLKGVQSWV
jgi:hypothetical protein